MLKISIVADKTEAYTELKSLLSREGFACSFISPGIACEQLKKQTGSLILLAIEDTSKMSQLARCLKEITNRPIISIITRNMLNSYPDLNTTLVLLSAGSSFLKLAVGGIGILHLVIFGIRWVYLWLQNCRRIKPNQVSEKI